MSRPARRWFGVYQIWDYLIGKSTAAQQKPSPLGFEVLEARIVPVRPLPYPAIFAGAGSGGSSVVNAYDALTGDLTWSVPIYSSNFHGGIRVAAGDFTGDGYPDALAAPGPGSETALHVLDGKSGEQIDGVLGDFQPFGTSGMGGIYVAADDLDGDGTMDAIAASGSRVRAISGETGEVIADFRVHGAAFHSGMTIAAADSNGDKRAGVIVGAGSTDEVRIYDPLTGLPVSSFHAFDSTVHGVFVAANTIAGDVNGDATPDIAVGTGQGNKARVRIFDGTDVALLREITPSAFGNGGVRVALAYVDDDSFADIVIWSGPGTPATIQVYSGATSLQLDPPQGEYSPFPDSSGVFVAASNDPLIDTVTVAPESQSVMSGFPAALGFNVTFLAPVVEVFYIVTWGDGSYTSETHTFPGGGLSDILLASHLYTPPSLPFIEYGYLSLTAYDGLGGSHHIAQTAFFDITITGVSPPPPPPQADLQITKTDNSATYSPAGSIQYTIIVTNAGPSFVTGAMVADTIPANITGASWMAVYTGVGSTGPSSGFGDINASVDLAVGGTATFTITGSVLASATGDLSNTATVTTPAGTTDPTPGNNSATDTDAPAVPTPPFLAPSGDGSYAGPLGNAAGAGGQTRGGFTVTGLNPTTGGISISRSDLFSVGFGSVWGQTWTWTNTPGYSDGISGSGATQTQAPHLVQVSGDNSIALVSNSSTAHFFNLVGSVYQAQFYDTATMLHDTLNGLFVVTDGTGQTLTFYDFSGIAPTGRAGKLISLADPAGGITQVISWDAAGRPTEVQRTSGSGPTALTESFVSTYVASGVNTGLLETVTQRTRVGTGPWATTRSTEYSYYDGTSGPGLAGALKLALVKDASGGTIDTDYYRYYTTGTGSAGNMHFAFGTQSFGLLTAALGTNLDSLTDSQVAPFVDKALEYDVLGRVTMVVDAAAGCSVCSGGQGTFGYTYTSNPASPAADENVWSMKTIETLPDGSTNLIYTNAFGQIMLEAFHDVNAAGDWLRFYRYDSSGRTVLMANPSAITGYDDSYNDLVNFVSGNAQYLSDTDGLITRYQYASTTTTMGVTPGDVAGYLKETDITHGELGTLIPQESMNYFERITAQGSFFHIATDTVYRNDNGTGGQTTLYAYTFQGSTNQIESITTTLPTVTVAQNGSGFADSFTTVRDAFGRPVWTKDQAGFIAYVSYDDRTGAVVKMISDVDTTQTATFANLPSGWTTPAGGGRHLTTSYEVDSLGRVTKETTPAGRIDFLVYNDANQEVRSYSGWNATTNTPTGPTMVSRFDLAGGYYESLTMSATANVSGGRPTGTEAIANLESLSRSYTNDAGQVIHSDDYFNLTGLVYSTAANIGTENVNFYRTRFDYDEQGRLDRTVTPQGTIYRTVFDGQGRAVSDWIGTNDMPTSGEWSPTNNTGTSNMVKVSDYQYDSGGVGDSNLTQVVEHPGGSEADRVTEMWSDWRNRQVAVKSGMEASESADVNRPLVYTDYDNLGETIRTRVYDSDGVTPTIVSGVPQPPSASLLRAQSSADFDELGRAFHSDTYSVHPSTGTVAPNTLHSDMWFDSRGYAVKMASPGGLVQKETYDGAGFNTASFLTDGGGDSSYADADDVTGDIVLSQTDRTFDNDGNVLLIATHERFHDALGTGPLGWPTSGVPARVSYIALYYDTGSRFTDSVNVGTNGGTAWTRPPSVPVRSDTVLVSSQTFDSAGRVFETTDPRGLVSRTLYDALGRTVTRIENHVDGVVSDSDDKTVSYTYNSAGMTSLTAHLTGGGVQTTEWVYGVSVGTGSTITSNDIVGVTRWPDPTTGAASSVEQETTTIDSLGQTLTMTDRNGTIHAPSYDILGRVTSDAVLVLGAGVDGGVLRIDTAYDSQGNAFLVTSFDAAVGGNIVNQVKREFNGLGQMIAEWQEHGGSVTGSSQRVQYAYSEMAGGANHSRLTSMTYPSGFGVNYNYSAGLTDSISRLSSLSDASGIVESYDYLGAFTVVRRSHPQPGVDLTYIRLSGHATGDAGDQYIGLDRFTRIVDQFWMRTSNGKAASRFQYGYDRDSNRLFRDDLAKAKFGELYAYDGLNQLASFQRGRLNHTNTGINGQVSRSQDWNYDSLGNWDSLTTDGSTQSRTANAQNEITSISGATTPTYDSNGNMIGDETGKTFVYDAWNRLVAVKSGAVVLKDYGYDGLNRRVTETVGATTTDLLYSAAWQVLEEKVGSNTTKRYVWSPVYVDAMILRDRDTDANGTLDERLWVMQDANWNVVGLVDSAGNVVERYGYDPFGVRTVYDASYGLRSGGSAYDFQHGFQGMAFDTVSGTYKSRGRTDYSPTLGRFTTVDPTGLSPDVNGYRFVGNKPVNATDPSGQTLYISGRDADVWRQKFGQFINLVPVPNGLFQIEIRPAGRQGWAFHNAAADYIRSLDIVGGEEEVRQALIILFDGGVAAPSPDYDPASDRLLDRPPGDMGRRNERYRLMPLWAFGIGLLPPPLPVQGGRRLPWLPRQAFNIAVTVRANVNNGGYDRAATSGGLVGGIYGASIGFWGTVVFSDKPQNAPIGGAIGGTLGVASGGIFGYAGAVVYSIGGAVITDQPYIFNNRPAFAFGPFGQVSEERLIGALSGTIPGWISGFVGWQVAANLP